MRLKSAYRGKPANQIPIEDRNIPAIKIDGEKVEPDIAVHAERGGEPESDKAVDAALETALKADEAANTLRRQIEALRQSEELQRQQAAAMVAQAPPTREQLLAHWKNQGTSEAEIKFLEQNPELIDIPELTAAAATAAQQQGHKRGTEAHMHVTRELFYKILIKFRRKPRQRSPGQNFSCHHRHRHQRQALPAIQVPLLAVRFPLAVIVSPAHHR